MKRKGLIGLFLCLFVMATTSGVMAATLQVGDVSIAPGGTVKIPIYAISAAADATGVAGAAFTVVFDDTVLTNANITSDFFGTFQSQLTTANPNYTGPTEADGYDKPLVDNALSGTGVAVAAANVQAQAIESGEGTVIFYLNGTVSSNAAIQDYEIRIIPTELNNTNAGYDAAGENIDLLIGAGENIADPADPAAFPVLLSAAGHDSASSSGTLSVSNKGDWNGDGEITAQDAVDVFNASLNTTWTPEELAAGDWNGDGEITAQDAVDIFFAQF